MGISPAQIRVIARVQFLHDIGKMAIPDEILRKPGKLTKEEMTLCGSTARAATKCSARSPSSARLRRLSLPTRNTLTAPATQPHEGTRFL